MNRLPTPDEVGLVNQAVENVLNTGRQANSRMNRQRRENHHSCQKIMLPLEDMQLRTVASHDTF